MKSKINKEVKAQIDNKIADAFKVQRKEVIDLIWPPDAIKTYIEQEMEQRQQELEEKLVDIQIE